MDAFVTDAQIRDSASFIAFLQNNGYMSGDEPILGSLRQAGRTSYGDLHDAALIPAPRLADAVAAFHGLQRADDQAIIYDPELLESLSIRFLRGSWLFPCRLNGTVAIATADPTRTDDIAVLQLAMGEDVPLAVASFDALAARFDEATSERRHTGAAAAVEPPLSIGAGDIERLHDLASDAPIVTAVDGLVEAALIAGATDIHVEMEQSGARIRLRVDGVLRLHERVAEETARGIISRVKILSGLNIAERRLPQDGRARMRIGTLETDIRVATAPALHGESLVMRLLARGAHALDLARLGMAPDDLGRFSAHLEQPHGMIVVTGPTGSGKTTTLTAALAALNRSDRKIMTVEDPIEYQIPGISQTQVRPGIALDFATALRAFLRHDPDILMVGEMRDGETAAVGIQAALTGHLLLTTLHTNSAADAVTRLVDLGVEPFLINATLRCVVGQRLVRQLCPHCRTVDQHAGRALKPFADSGRLTIKADAVIYHAEGCSQCAQTGYRGRIGIFEVLSVDESLRGMIRSGHSAGDIEAAAVSRGMTTMLQDGYAKVCAGQTSVDELLKATI